MTDLEHARKELLAGEDVGHSEDQVCEMISKKHNFLLLFAYHYDEFLL